jgi:DNA-binding Lrp family transcriptional regulator
MSKNALFYYAENLHLVQRATFTTTSGKESGLGENGRDLLVFLCNASNEKQGWTFYMGNAFIAEEANIHISTVKRLMAGLEQLGWITRTGTLVRHQGRGAPHVEYALTFFPPCAENMRTGRSTGRSGATDNLAKPVQSLNNDYFLGLQPEPKPETEPKPESGSVVSKSARQEKAGISVDEVLRICIELETEGMTLRGAPILPGVINKWKAEYPSVIAKAITEGHGDTTEDVAWYCHNLRAETRTGRKAQGSYAGVLPRFAQGRQLPDAPKGMEGCLVCNGDGYGIVRDSAGVAKTRKCVCAGGTWEGEPTQEPTTKRVSTDQSSNTYVPTPGGSADPQSGAKDIRDITGQLKRKFEMPAEPLQE